MPCGWLLLQGQGACVAKVLGAEQKSAGSRTRQGAARGQAAVIDVGSVLLGQVGRGSRPTEGAAKAVGQGGPAPGGLGAVGSQDGASEGRG